MTIADDRLRPPPSAREAGPELNLDLGATLRALRELYPTAHISYLLRRYVKPVYEGMPWADRLITYRTGKTRAKAGKGTFDVAGRFGQRVAFKSETFPE